MNFNLGLYIFILFVFLNYYSTNVFSSNLTMFFKFGFLFLCKLSEGLGYGSSATVITSNGLHYVRMTKICNQISISVQIASSHITRILRIDRGQSCVLRNYSKVDLMAKYML